jgi:DNA-binding PucR family transcriptional regulator
MQTMRAYLKCGRNPAKTASLLGIHRNSVDYRLRRMQELFDLDIDDPNIMFSFEQSLQIIDYLEKNK